MTIKNDLAARLMPITPFVDAKAANDQLTRCLTYPDELSCLRIFGAVRPWRHKPKPGDILEARMGRDAAHRTRNLPTHPTHGCITLFCGFSSALLARSQQFPFRSPAFAPVLERALSALGRV